MKPICHLLLTSIFVVLNAFGLRCQTYKVNHIDYTYGLSNSQIISVNKDAEGFIWIGTIGGGMYRWDGNRLEPFSEKLKFTVIDELLPTKNSGVWVSHKGELSRLLSKNVLVDVDLKPLTAAKSDEIRSLYEVDDFVVTVSNQGQFSLIDQTTLEILDTFVLKNNLSGNFKVIFEAGEFNILDSKYYSRIKISNSSFQESNKESFDSIAASEQIATPFFTMNRANGFWFIQEEQKLHQLSNDFRILNTYTFETAEHFKRVEFFKGDYFIAAESGLWVTDLGKEDPDFKKLVDYPIYKILTTEDNLWVGSFFGLFQVTKPFINRVSIPDSLSTIDGYFDFVNIDGDTWAASFNSGIHIYNGEQLLRKIEFSRPYSNSVRCFLQVSEEKLLVGTFGGLYTIDLSTKKIYPDNEMEMAIYSLVINNGIIYAGTRSGSFFKFEDDNWIQIGNDLFGPIWDLYCINNQIFIGTDKGMFQLIDGVPVEIELLENTEPFPITSFEPINNSEIAIGTGGLGILIYNFVENGLSRVINEKSGISSDFVLSLGFTEKQLWVGSNGGIDVIKLNERDFQISNLKEVYSKAGAESYLGSFYRNEDKIWISTIVGTLTIPVDIVEKSNLKSKHQIVIDKITFFSTNGEVDSIITIPKKNEKLKIPSKYNNVKIEFNYPSFNSKKHTFGYQLENYDEKATKITEKGDIIYKQLPLGNYNLSIWQDSKKFKKSDAVSFEFEFVPAFYQSTGFKVMVLLLFLMFIYVLIKFAYRYKANQLVARIKFKEQIQNDLRKEIVIDFHDEIGNHLAKIISISGALKVQDLQAQHKKLVDRIEVNAKELFTSTRDLIWSLKQSSCDLEEIFINIKEFGNHLFHGSNIDFTAEKTKGLKDFHLNAKESRDLKLILKETLTNAFKHSGADTVSVTFMVGKDSTLKITVKDNGVGFKDLDKRAYSGLNNIKIRSKRSQFTTEVRSDIQKGTVVCVKFKLKTDV